MIMFTKNYIDAFDSFLKRNVLPEDKNSKSAESDLNYEALVSTKENAKFDPLNSNFKPIDQILNMAAYNAKKTIALNVSQLEADAKKQYDSEDDKKNAEVINSHIMNLTQALKSGSLNEVQSAFTFFAGLLSSQSVSKNASEQEVNSSIDSQLSSISNALKLGNIDEARKIFTDLQAQSLMIKHQWSSDNKLDINVAYSDTKNVSTGLAIDVLV